MTIREKLLGYTDVVFHDSLRDFPSTTFAGNLPTDAIISTTRGYHLVSDTVSFQENGSTYVAVLITSIRTGETRTLRHPPFAPYEYVNAQDVLDSY